MIHLRSLVCAVLLHAVLPPAGTSVLASPARAQSGPAAVADDLETVRARIEASLLPTEPERAAVADSARRLLALQRPDGSWPDIDYADRARALWKPREHLLRLREMARAYRAPGQPLHGAPSLRDAIHRGLDRWFELDPQSDNWWYNQIGAPAALGETLLLVDAELSPERRRRGLALLRRSALERETSRGPERWTGANLVWMAGNMILRGVLEPSPEAVAEALEALFAEVRVASPGEEGIQTDLSFHQHGPVLYTGGYGAAFLADVIRFIRFAHGTRWAVEPERRELVERFVLEGVRPSVRGGYFDYAVTGRNITRPGIDARGLAGAVAALAELPGPRRDSLRAFAAGLRGDPGAPVFVGNRHFWRSDYMVHHRPEYFASVHMFSTRTGSTDRYINGEGKRSHHLADGMTLLYRRGDEYADIFPVWDWSRVPGATIEQGVERDPDAVGDRGRSDWVGGVSDGRSGLAVMDLRRDSLRAVKSWFFLGEAAVFLGTGIRGASDRTVLTSVNQTLRRGPVRDTVAAGMRVVEHDGLSYLFPDGAAVEVRAAPQAGSWAEIGAGPSERVTREVFSLWIDHGPGARTGEYAYTVVPSPADPGRVAEEVRVVSNTPALQAVHHRGEGLLQAAFHRPGRVDAGPGLRLSADRPVLLMLREGEDGIVLSLSNPRNEPLRVHVEIDRALAAAPGVETVGTGRSRIRMELPGGAEAGRSVTRAFRHR